MMWKVTRVLVAVLVSMALLALPAFACELAGPNVHIGEIKAIDHAQRSLTILDRQMKKQSPSWPLRNSLRGFHRGNWSP